MKKTLILAIMMSGLVVSGFAPVAWAYHGPQGSLDRVRTLADQVEDSTGRLLDLAQRTMPLHGFHQRRRLSSLSSLAREAGDFERRIDSLRPSRALAQRDYRQLIQAFDRAGYAMSRMKSSWLMQREFDRVETLIRRLDRSFDVLVATAGVRYGRFLEDPRGRRFLARGARGEVDDGYAEIDTVVRHRRGGSAAIAVRMGD
jgi:hypothetical protein